MSRSIIDVMDKIKAVTSSNELIEEMKRIEFDAGFKPPELMYQLWNVLHGRMLDTYESPFINDESLEAFSIFTGRSKEELLDIKRQEEEMLQQ